MKPPIVGYERPPPPDPRPALWIVGAIFGVAGLATLLLDNPLVPLTHEFQLLPLGLGGAIGSAVLREKYGPRAIAAYAVVMLWLVWQVVATKTTGGTVWLAASLFSLTRALILTVNDD